MRYQKTITRENFAPKHPRHSDYRPDLPDTQAARIFAKFGGVPRLVEALAEIDMPRDRTAVYRWNHPVSKGGTGGVVPGKALRAVLAAARHWGILITPEDLYPLQTPRKRGHFKPREVVE